MQSRPYRPDIARFTTPDRFEDALGDFALQSDPLTQNRYAFGAGSPINNIEFDGHGQIDPTSNTNCAGVNVNGCSQPVRGKKKAGAGDRPGKPGAPGSSTAGPPTPAPTNVPDTAPPTSANSQELPADERARVEAREKPTAQNVCLRIDCGEPSEFALGVDDSLREAVLGPIEAVANPIDTTSGVYNTITDPMGTLRGFEEYYSAPSGRGGGRVVGDIFTLPIAVTKAGKVGKLDKMRGESRDKQSPDGGDDTPTNSTPCGPNSFIAGTRVLLASGELVPIESVRVGDYVLQLTTRLVSAGHIPSPDSSVVTG